MRNKIIYIFNVIFGAGGLLTDISGLRYKCRFFTILLNIWLLADKFNGLIGARSGRLVLFLCEYFVNLRDSCPLHEFSLAVLRPILYRLIHIGCRDVFFLSCDIFKNVFFFLFGDKSLDAVEHPVVVRDIVTVDAPLLFLLSEIVGKGAVNLRVSRVESL